MLLSKAKLQLAEADVVRAEGIAKTPGAISKQDIDRYMSARTEAAASLKSSEAMVDTAKLKAAATASEESPKVRDGKGRLCLVMVWERRASARWFGSWTTRTVRRRGPPAWYDCRRPGRHRR